MFYAGVPSSLGFGVGGQSYSNFLASTIETYKPIMTWLTLLKGLISGLYLQLLTSKWDLDIETAMRA